RLAIPAASATTSSTLSNWWTPAAAPSFGRTLRRSKSRGWKTRLIVDCRAFLGTTPSMNVLASSCLVGVLFAGCATTQTGENWQRTGDPLVDGRAAIEHSQKRDRTLWEYRTAATAMRRGEFGEAKQWLDDALLTLGGIYGPDKDARKARSYFASEAKKTFIGEPYERVMAYYYRGILYWIDGELDNARACFRSGEIMDSDAENKT